MNVTGLWRPDVSANVGTGETAHAAKGQGLNVRGTWTPDVGVRNPSSDNEQWCAAGQSARRRGGRRMGKRASEGNPGRGPRGRGWGGGGEAVIKD